MVTLRRTLFLVLLSISFCVLWTTLDAQERAPDVRFVPTPEAVVMEMLKMAKVTKDDI
jgi:hypothetical protein